MESSTEQVKTTNNPEGKGGFGDNPENINAGGRPKNSLKSYVAKKLAEMSDKDKDKYLKSIAKDFQWQMGEGNPHSTEDSKVELTLPKPLLGGESHGNNNDGNEEAPKAKEE